MNPTRYMNVHFCSPAQVKPGTKVYYGDRFLGRVVYIREHEGKISAVSVDIPDRGNLAIYRAEELNICID